MNAKITLHREFSIMEEKVKPAVLQAVPAAGGKLEGKPGSKQLEITLPPASWNVIRLKT